MFIFSRQKKAKKLKMSGSKPKLDRPTEKTTNTTEKKTDSANNDSKLLNDVLMELFRLNTELAGLSKAVVILEQDISLYKLSPGMQAQLVYTEENLPMVPIATDINQFRSGELAVAVPVKTVDEVKRLNTILEDKIAFQALVSFFE